MKEIDFYLHNDSPISIEQHRSIYQNHLIFEYNLWIAILFEYKKQHVDEAMHLYNISHSCYEEIEYVPYTIDELSKGLEIINKVRSFYIKHVDIEFNENSILLDEDGDRINVQSNVGSKEIVAYIDLVIMIWKTAIETALPFGVYIDF